MAVLMSPNGGPSSRHKALCFVFSAWLCGFLLDLRCGNPRYAGPGGDLDTRTKQPKQLRKSWGLATSVMRRFERLSMKEMSLIDNMKHVLVAYHVEFAPGSDARRAAALMAAGSSTGVGRNPLVKWSKFAESIGAVVYDFDPEHQDVRVAFSVALFDRSFMDGSVLMSSVLAMALGHESEDILSYEIRDIFFPMGFLRLFDGPAVNGQDLWRSMSRPRKGGGMILGAVLRPRTGLLPEDLGAACLRLWKDCDLIRSDEHQQNQVYCPVDKAIPEVVRAMRVNVEETNQQKFFLVTLSAEDPGEMVARAKFVLETFGPFAPNCGFQLSGPPGSLSSLRALRRAFPAQFLHYHAAGAVAVRGLHSRRSYSAFVHSKLARMLGASSALLGVDLKASAVASLPNLGVRQALCETVGVLCGDDTRGVLFEQEWEGMKQTLPVISGDLHALHLPFLFAALGHSDILLTPTVSYAKKDSTPGARSFRAAEQAWRGWRDGGSNVSLPEFILDYARMLC